MKLPTITALLLLAIAAPGWYAAAQEAPTRITASIGWIDSSERSIDDRRFAPYPELEISRVLVRHMPTHISLSGGLYWGFWADEDAPGVCVDCHSYDYRTHVVGTRLAVALERALVPISIHLGFSRHFLVARYIGGEGIAGNKGSDYTSSHNTLEAGVRLTYPLLARVRIGATSLAYLPLRTENRPSRVAVGGLVSVGI